MTLRRPLLFSVLAATYFCGLVGSSQAAELGGHSQSEPKERLIVEKTYANFFRAHPDTLFTAKVVPLDDTKIGSIVVNFQSPLTCNSDGCLTNILHWNKGWKEVFSQHLKALNFEGYSTVQGHNYRRVVARGLTWLYTPRDGYQPDITSVKGAHPPKPVLASNALVQAVISSSPTLKDHPTNNERGAFHDYQLTLNGLTPTHIVSFDFNQDCGEGGCSFEILTGTDATGYKVILPYGRYMNFGAFVVQPQTTNNWNDLVVLNGPGLDFYHNINGTYVPYRTTYASPVTRAP